MIITYNNPTTKVKITIEGTHDELSPLVLELVNASNVATKATRKTSPKIAKEAPKANTKATPAKKSPSSSTAGDLRAIFESLELPNNLL
jgi:hypothetical protein